MATEQIPLLFFKVPPGVDALVIAETLMAGLHDTAAVAVDAGRVLQSLKATRGFARLKITLPSFHFDNPRLEVAFNGTATRTHLALHLFGNFERIAQPLFSALTAQGLVCYSVWDKQILNEWPQWEEPYIDKGFASRMEHVVVRKTLELRQTVPDAKQRSRLLAAFVQSEEFRAEMARQARLEEPSGKGHKKTYADAVNCFARWKNGHPSASELAVLRKLDSKFAAMSITDLRALAGQSPRLLLLAAVPPHQAAEYRDAAERQGLMLDIEPL